MDLPRQWYSIVEDADYPSSFGLDRENILWVTLRNELKAIPKSGGPARVLLSTVASPDHVARQVLSDGTFAYVVTEPTGYLSVSTEQDAGRYHLLRVPLAGESVPEELGLSGFFGEVASDDCCLYVPGSSATGSGIDLLRFTKTSQQWQRLFAGHIIHSVAVDQDYIYWSDWDNATNDGTIYRLAKALDSEPTVLATGSTALAGRIRVTSDSIYYRTESAVFQASKSSFSIPKRLWVGYEEDGSPDIDAFGAAAFWTQYANPARGVPYTCACEMTANQAVVNAIDGADTAGALGSVKVDSSGIYLLEGKAIRRAVLP